jgi:Condensation domain
MRVSLFSRSARDYVLLLVIHHIVVDFWSLAVILSELGVLDLAEMAGRSVSLPPLDLRYIDFVLWQDAMLAGRLASGSGPTGRSSWAARYQCSICLPTGRGHRSRCFGARSMILP